MNELDRKKLEATAANLALNPTDIAISTALTYAYFLGRLEGTEKTGTAMIYQLERMSEKKTNGLAE